MSSGPALVQTSVPTNGALESSYQSLLSSPQSVLDAIPGAVCICSADGAVVRFNRTATSLWGRTPVAGGAEDQFCGAFRLLHLDGTYLPHAESPMATVLRAGEPVRDREVIIERPGGSRVIALVNIEPLKDESGRVQGAINCFQDITTRKRAESALDTRAHRLSMLNRIARTLSSDMGLQQIVQAVTDRATELTGAKFGAFFYNVSDTDGERYLLYTLSGAPRAAFDGFGLPRNTALFEPTFRGETVVRCDDVRKDRRYGLSPPHYGMPKGHLPVVSYLAVPVISRSGEVQGGLFFAHDKPGVFTAEAEELVVGIAAHAAIAIDNARLLQAAAKRADQQTALYQFTDRLQRAEALTDICEAALDAILHASKCDRASILQLDHTGVMRFVASRGLSDAYRKAVEGHSPWPPDAKNPKPICIQDVAAAELGDELRGVIQAEGIQALAFFPLVSNGKLIGKFMAYYAAPHAFTSEDIDVCLTIARQLVFSLERLRTEEARRRAETALQAREAELDTIISRTPFLLARCSRDFTYRLVSQAYADMLGRRPDDVAGKAIVEVLGSQAVADIRPHVEEVLQGKRVEYKSEIHIDGVGSRFVHAVYLPDEDEQGCVQGWIESIRDITEQKRAETQRDILAAELSHRVKNTLATMQAIAAQSLRGADVGRDVRDRFEGRLLSLSDAHNILARHNWEGGDLAEVIRETLRRHGTPERFSIEGPRVSLSPNALLAIAMATHELALNAAKFGALSNDEGQVSISWHIGSVSPPVLTLKWQETGGPPVDAPQRRGFGSRLIERNLAVDLQGEAKLEYCREGVICTITTPIDAINPRRNLSQSNNK